MRYIARSLVLGSILIFSGCHQPIGHTNSKLHEELEARNYDVPVLLNAIPIQTLCSQDMQSNSMMLGYSVRQSVDEAVEYYLQEMERLGWQELYRVANAETLLSFEKPQKYASISIRPAQDKTNIIIFIRFK